MIVIFKEVYYCLIFVTLDWQIFLNFDNNKENVTHRAEMALYNLQK